MLCLEAMEMLKISYRPCVADKIKFIFNRTLYSPTFTGRDFLVHESHGDSGTLYTRFIKHLAIENCKFDPIIPQTIKYSSFYPISDVRYFNSTIKNVPIEQIPRLIVFTYTYKTNGDPHKVAHVLNQIDEICTEKIDLLDFDAILRIFYAFMYVIPNKITKLRFFESGMRRLLEEFKSSYPKEKFVQTCFYLGLSKRNAQSNPLMKQFITTNLQTYLDQLTTLDFAIVSNAIYKTSLMIDIKEFNERLVQETKNANCNDDALLVTFIKSLRLNRIKSKTIYEQMKTHLLHGEMDYFQFKGLNHCFAYFAEGLWNDPEVCKVIVDKCLQKLHDLKLADDGDVFNDFRPKDFATFLWCCAILDVSNLTENDLHFIEEIILKKFECNQYRNCPDELIDSALSLWMLGYKSQEMISSILQLKEVPILKRSERIKLDSRFKLLLNCVQIEKSEWLSKKFKDEKIFIENRQSPDYLIKNRTALQTVNRILNEQKDDLGIISSSIVCPINEINIAGILVETNQGKIYLEILEKNQLLAFNDTPTAIVQLKVKLLKYLGYNVQLIASNDYATDDELLSILKKKLIFEDVTLKIKEAAA